ncbi:MAG TPA: hypothetical protein VFS00_33655, partial [Polyangiaceae bacterium]|nr:hypothetical protein [Polyangiaceae bacterium]
RPSMNGKLAHRRFAAGRLARAAALAAGAALAAPPASAQAPGTGPTELATARALGIEGVKLADANNCAEAVPKLDRSERIHHAPTTLGRLGECHVQLGALVLGTELLQRVVREPLPPNAPAVFVAAKARAQQVLDQALPKIGKLRISVKAPPDARPAVAIDGEPVSSALLEVDRPTDPGPHRVEASAPGFRAASATVTLREGGSESVSLVLEPDPNAQRVEPPGPAAAPTAAPTVAPPPAPAPAPERSSTPRLVAYGALGVGAAGLVAGSVLGALTISKSNDLEGQCPNKQCATPAAQDDLDGASRLGTWSTVAFGVGAVGLVGGVVLLLTSSPGASASAAAPGPAVRPRVGFGSLGLEGTF